MIEEYQNKLDKMLSERNDFLEVYNFELNELNMKYLSIINLLKRKKVNRLYLMAIIILLYILLMLVYFLASINGLLIPITSGVFGGLLLLVLVIFTIGEVKRSKREKIYNKEMIGVSANFKKARIIAEQASNYIYMLIALTEKKQNDLDIAKEETLIDEYKDIVNQRIKDSGMQISAEAIVDYYELWKQKKNDEFIEVDLETRKALIARKSK